MVGVVHVGLVRGPAADHAGPEHLVELLDVAVEGRVVGGHPRVVFDKAIREARPVRVELLYAVEPVVLRGDPCERGRRVRVLGGLRGAREVGGGAERPVVGDKEGVRHARTHEGEADGGQHGASRPLVSQAEG